jgi:hypothetical protein
LVTKYVVIIEVFEITLFLNVDILFRDWIFYYFNF